MLILNISNIYIYIDRQLERERERERERKIMPTLVSAIPGFCVNCTYWI